MGKKPSIIEISDMSYWSSGDDIGECDSNFCSERAFSYNEDGEKYCESCLSDWHEKKDEEARKPQIKLEKQFKCNFCESVHLEKENAEKCCDHIAEVYLCPECSNDYEQEDEALECC